MAQRRMMSLKIIDTDKFLEMPLSTQCLYFHLLMRADDDGFIGNTKKIMRIIGSSDDDLKILFAKQYIIPFESGVCVIKDWKIHNYIQKDRYDETIYLNEKSQLQLDENARYNLISGQCIQNVYKLDTQDRLGKDSIELEKEKINVQIENYFNEFWKKYPRKVNKKKTRDKFIHLLVKDKIDYSVISKGLDNYIKQIKDKGTAPEYIAHPTTWLNGARWEDDYGTKEEKKYNFEEALRNYNPNLGTNEVW